MTTQTPDPALTEPTTDEATTPTTDSPTGTRRVKPLGWGRTNPSPETQMGDGSAEDLDSLALSEELPESRSPKTGGSRTSSRGNKRELRAAIKAGFSGVTGLAHDVLVHDQYAQALEVLIADDEDATNVANPAANILERRMKDAPLSPDVADGIELAMAVFAYAMKQLNKLRVARAMRAENAVIGDGLQHEYTPEPQEPGAP